MTHVRYLDGARPHDFGELVENAIVETGARTVADLGGGANPMLRQEFVAAHGLRYIVVDASERQLAMAPAWCDKVVADLEAASRPPIEKCDIVFSKWVLEHVRDPAAFHASVRETLREGGKALHFFPTLYAMPFLFNRVTPEALSERLLRRVMAGRERGGNREKFPAHYRWCRGPTRRQIKRFRRLGYSVDEYAGYFGHVYFERLKPVHRLELQMADLLRRHPIAHATSFAHVVLTATQHESASQISPSTQ